MKNCRLCNRCVDIFTNISGAPHEVSNEIPPPPHPLPRFSLFFTDNSDDNNRRIDVLTLQGSEINSALE